MTLENINIRILTGLRPLNTNKLGGLFPLIRYNELINRGIPCEMYMITNTYSKGVKIFYQLLKGMPYIDNETGGQMQKNRIRKCPKAHPWNYRSFFVSL